MDCPESLRTQAYFDGELDAASAAAFEGHLGHCAQCRATLESAGRLRTSMRQALAHERAPAALRARIAQALDQEQARPRRSGQRRPFWLGALSGIGAAAVAATVAFLVLTAPVRDPLLDRLVAAHVHSLLPDHLIAVVSTDRHTVKPWFAGRADVSPVVADFAAQGFRLLGGRIDVLDHQRAAVVVYQHGPHLVNVFSWAVDRRLLPRDATRNGYHIAFWSAGNVQYCAVSDTGWSELLALEQLLRDTSRGEERPE
ncbi:MAG TPA: zf-HC2 domain-containing protein [Steroidobacteraceae bacterium]|nr:zf-HC2 domain-containing protein [Steroidobacteraceae bacterium]